jgi:hypothetical protein
MRCDPGGRGANRFQLSRGTQQVFFTRVWPLSMREVDAAVDIDPCYMHAFWSEVAGQRLRQPAFGKITRPERTSHDAQLRQARKTQPLEPGRQGRSLIAPFRKQ